MDIAHFISTLFLVLATCATLLVVMFVLIHVAASFIEKLAFTWHVPELLFYVEGHTQREGRALMFPHSSRYAFAYRIMGVWSVYTIHHGKQGCLVIPFSPLATFLSTMYHKLGITTRSSAGVVDYSNDAPRWSTNEEDYSS